MVEVIIPCPHCGGELYDGTIRNVKDKELGFEVHTFCSNCGKHLDHDDPTIYVDLDTGSIVKAGVFSEIRAVHELKKGFTVQVRGIGNSMTPILKSGQVVTVNPILPNTTLEKGDIVLCKVRGNTYMHKITGVKGDQFQISNNHGHVNGWTTRKQVFGKLA